MNSEELKELFKQASEVAGVVPENMQGEAFNRALEVLRGDAPEPQRQEKHRTQQRAKQTTPSSADLDPKWYEQINSTEHHEVADAKNNLTQSLMILQIAHEELGIDTLSPAEISAALKEKFKLKVSSTTVSARLGEATKLVDRSSSGSGHRYRLMLPGEKYIRGEFDGPVGAGMKKPSAKKATKDSEEKSAPKATKASKTNRSTNGRPAQRKLLETLIDEGFFDDPKTVGDIIQYVKDNLAYTYKATDLSTPLVRMVRNKQLKRSTNGESQFEYSKS